MNKQTVFDHCVFYTCHSKGYTTIPWMCDDEAEAINLAAEANKVASDRAFGCYEPGKVSRNTVNYHHL